MIIMPKWYYCRGGNSDMERIRANINKLRRKVSPSRTREICDQYEELYLVNGHVDVTVGRLAANAYLDEMVEYYETAKDERSKSEHISEFVEHQKLMVRLSNEAAKGSKKSLDKFNKLAVEHEEQRQQYTPKTDGPMMAEIDRIYNEQKGKVK